MLKSNFPIIDLHCHVEGSIDPQKSFEILHDVGHPQAQNREEFFKRVTSFESGRDGFFGAISLLNMCLINRTAVIKVISDIIIRAAEQNVKILEPTFALREFKLQESGNLRPFTEAVLAGVETGTHNQDIAVGLRFIILPRHLTDEFYGNYGDIRKIIAEYRQHIIGVDICTLDNITEEQHNPYRLKEFCEFVKESGLHLSGHAGEFIDAKPVEKAIDLGVERIGHGIRIIDDKDVLEQVKDQNITLEVCPISNYRTGAVASSCEHPLQQLLKAGVRVTINSDDQGVQNSNWRDDYDFAMEKIGLTETEIRKCLRYSFEASFLSAKEKDKYSGLFIDNEQL